MFEVLFNVLNAGLILWSNKEKRKYIDELMHLKEQFYEEYNKPITSRSDAILDHIDFKLRVLGTAFAADVGKSNSPDIPGSSRL